MGRVIWLEPDAAGDSSLYDSLGYFSYEIANIYYCQEMQRQKSASNNHIPQALPKTKHHWSSFPPQNTLPLILQGSWSPISAWIKASRGNPWALPWRSPQPGQRNTTLDSLNNGINVFPIFTFIKMLILMKLLSMGIQHCKIWLQLCSGLRSFGPPWTQGDAYQWLQGVIEQSAHIELSHRKET